MANSIALAEKYQPLLDEVMRDASVTSVLERGDMSDLFVGAKYVKIPKMFLDGLADYTRLDGSGYPSGSVNIEQQLLELTKDRAKKFQFDYMDEEETGITAAQVFSQFIRQQVAPEVDAYRLSKIASLAATTLTAQTISANTIISVFNTAISAFEDAGVPRSNWLLFVSSAVMALIRSTTELSKFITQVDYNSPAGVTFSLKAYDGIPIIVVPKERFYSSYTFGATGFGPASGAKLINFLLVDAAAIWPVKKHERIKIWSPEENQGGDGYAMAYRIYHDLFVPENKRLAVYANVSNADATLFGNIIVTSTAGAAANGTILTVSRIDGGVRGKLVYLLGNSSIAVPAYGASTSSYTDLTSGAEIAASTNTHAIVAVEDANSKALLAVKVTLVKGQ